MIPKNYDLGASAVLRVCATDRFKAGALSVSSVMPIDRDTACMAPLLLSVLRRGTEKYPQLSHINRRLDYLWGTAFSIRSFYRGNCQVLGFTADLLDPSYLPSEGEQIIDGVLELMEQLLFHPLLDEDGLLSAKYVESEKLLQCDAIRATKNHSRTYAAERCKSILLEGESGGLPLYGTEEQTMAVTRESLTVFWRNWVENLRLDCFYVGGEPAETILQKLENVFGDRLVSRPKVDLQILGTPHVGRAIRVSETMPVSQSQLMIAFRCDVQMNHPDDAVCTVLNEMLGNSPISRLFVYVREKQSLCYSCASSYSAYYGTLLISCGLKSENREKAEQEIFRQVQCLGDGDFRQEELDAAKKSLENAYRQIEDSPSGLESYYFGRALANNQATLDEYRQALRAVTAEDVVRVAKTLTLDVVYFLEGTQIGDEGEDEDEED